MYLFVENWKNVVTINEVWVHVNDLQQKEIHLLRSKRRKISCNMVKKSKESILKVAGFVAGLAN